MALKLKMYNPSTFQPIYSSTFQPIRKEMMFKEYIIKLFENWAIEDLVKNRIANKKTNEFENNDANDIENEFADIDDTIAYFKNQNRPSCQLFNNEQTKNIKKRNFTLAFGEEIYDTAPIGILYPGPKWNDKIYPSEESDDQLSNDDDQELHKPI